MFAYSAPQAERLRIEGELPSLDGATGWLNSPPLTAGSLRGKVALIDFWTYSCINRRRTLPYVRVRQATKEMSIEYPVAIDSGFAIWRAFDNDYWPALYFVDANGRVRHHQFGEGDYEESERVIQRLLAEAGRRPMAAMRARRTSCRATAPSMTSVTFMSSPRGCGSIIGASRAIGRWAGRPFC